MDHNQFSFHLIGFPSEWGDLDIYKNIALKNVPFPFNWVPQRVGRSSSSCSGACEDSFPFNWVPQRVGRKVNQ